MRLGTPLTALAVAGLTVLAGAAPSAGAPVPAPAAAAPPAAMTTCSPAAPLEEGGAERPAGPSVGLCVTVAGVNMTVTAAADCACTVTGTWTAHRGDEGESLSGTLGGRAEYQGPGTYEITATVSVSGTPRSGSVPLRGTVTGTFALAAPMPAAAHRVEVTPKEPLAPGTTTALTYTVERTADGGDGSARLGIIGEPDTGVRLASTDVRCVNPLTGRYPSTDRSPHAVDCTLTDLQPGRPATVTVHVTLPDGVCSSVVSKLGYWSPQGQQVTGGMVNGPTVSCG
ncbi:hypothetical protein [Streptomyces thermolilacinus]|uniref:hypothetical protein n=1 Tax=Streptomyces thermolilacinus TaxID=285540 RepID=UPI0033DCCBE4